MVRTRLYSIDAGLRLYLRPILYESTEGSLCQVIDSYQALGLTFRVRPDKNITDLFSMLRMLSLTLFLTNSRNPPIPTKEQYTGTANSDVRKLCTVHCGRNVNKPSAPAEVEDFWLFGQYRKYNSNIFLCHPLGPFPSKMMRCPLILCFDLFPLQHTDLTHELWRLLVYIFLVLDGSRCCMYPILLMTGWVWVQYKCLWLLLFTVDRFSQLFVWQIYLRKTGNSFGGKIHRTNLRWRIF